MSESKWLILWFCYCQNEHRVLNSTTDIYIGELDDFCEYLDGMPSETA